jgi:RIO-like serine/threonine protein kinase
MITKVQHADAVLESRLARAAVPLPRLSERAIILMKTKNGLEVREKQMEVDQYGTVVKIYSDNYYQFETEQAALQALDSETVSVPTNFTFGTREDVKYHLVRMVPIEEYTKREKMERLEKEALEYCFNSHKYNNGPGNGKA